VARTESVHLLLALAVAKDLCIHHLHVKSSFLNGELTKKVFVKKTSGFVIKGTEHKALLLRKVLYGLRQASRAWNTKLNTMMGEFGFTHCTTEHALFTQ
jgi:hypothetical protein